MLAAALRVLGKSSCLVVRAAILNRSYKGLKLLLERSKGFLYCFRLFEGYKSQFDAYRTWQI